VNRLKPLFETMLWKDEALPENERPYEIRNPRYKSTSTQVTESIEEQETENSEVFPATVMMIAGKQAITAIELNRKKKKA